MLNRKLISSLLELPSPLVTAYLNTQSVGLSARGPASGPWTLLKHEINRLVESVPPAEQSAFQEQVARLEKFLHDRTPKERALVVLAGPKTWELIPLQLQVENELHWGRPALSQLQWLLSENKPQCIVVLDRKGARFLLYRLGEMQELSEEKFDIDISAWKKKDLGHVEGQGVEKTRGSQRDTYEHRMDAQYKRLFRKAAAHAVRFCEAEGCDAIFLVGSDRLTEPVEAALPKKFHERAVLINEDFGGLSVPELQDRLTSKIAEWEGKQELALVADLVRDERRAVIGIDETLAQLQKGKVRTVVLARHLNGGVHECIDCGWTDRSADPVCRVCGRERRPMELRESLFDIARSKKTDIQVVSGEAEDKLNQSGGIGGWLRGRSQAELR